MDEITLDNKRRKGVFIQVMKKIIINNIRNINHMEFEIPSQGVHIITGENGVGKTTLFTCLSRICNNKAYRLGFPTTNISNYDEYRGSISYCINDEIVTYSRRQSGRWQPDINRNIFDEFNFKSIVHISTRSERIFTQVIEVPRRKQRADTWLIDAMNRILNTDKFSTMQRITVGDLRSRTGNADKRRRNTAFAVPLGGNRFYTEQNFSFGEIVLLNLLYDIESVENNSLVLIDELEMALHPSAQIRLMQYLDELSRQNSLTVLISTHSASIIKAQKDVILLERCDNEIKVYDKCPPAKAIGAIGMREDTMADIIVIVEDDMAKSLFSALMRKYISLCPESSYLDIRILGVGGYQNIINFYVEADSYIFYDNVYVTAFLDKDVETDIIPYGVYGNRDIIDLYNTYSRKIHFLPYTPEVLLYQEFRNSKTHILEKFRNEYNNQQVNYEIQEQIDVEGYQQPLSEFNSQQEYNNAIKERGNLRAKCKDETKRIAENISNQLNISKSEIYRFVFKYAVDSLEGTEINVRRLLAPTMKRLD